MDPCRNEGTGRRLLDVASEVKGRGDRMAQARPVRGHRGRDSQVFEAEDFGDEFTPELREQEERLRAEMEAKQK